MNSFILNQCLFDGINCLKIRRPFFSTILPLMQTFWYGLKTDKNCFLRVSTAVSILTSLSPERWFRLSLKCKILNNKKNLS